MYFLFYESRTMPKTSAKNDDNGNFDFTMFGISHKEIQKQSDGQRTKWLKVHKAFHEILETTEQNNIACVASEETGAQAIIQWSGKILPIPGLSCDEVIQKWLAVTTEIQQCQKMSSQGMHPTIVIDRFNGIPLTIQITCEQISSMKLIVMSTPGYASDPRTVYAQSETKLNSKTSEPMVKNAVESIHSLPSITSTFLSSAIYGAQLMALHKTRAWALQKCGMNANDAHYLAHSLKQTVSWGLLGWQSPWRALALIGGITFIEYLPLPNMEKTWVSALAPQLLYLAVDTLSETPVSLPSKVIQIGAMFAGNMVGQVLVEKAPSIWQACCNWWNPAPAPAIDENELPPVQITLQL